MSRNTRAGALGGAAAFVVFALLLTSAGTGVLKSQELGGFYDAQARSLLDGRWDVPPETVGLEGFVVDGRTYTYFGPWPAVLRLPLAAITDDLDGQLTVPSMLLAFLVMVVGVVRLTSVTRRLVRGREPAGWREGVLVGVLTFALCASVPLFLASRAWVYHEASLWGVALSLVAFDALVRYLEAPSARRLALSSVLAAGALLSRPSVGAGPVAALALLAGLVVLVRWNGGPSWAWLRRSRRRWTQVRAVPAWLPAAAVAVPLALSAGVNLAKFDSPFGVPFDRQIQSFGDPERQEVLAANDGNLFGLRFVPTAMVQYLRPDALGVSRLFPFVAFPDDRAAVIGDVRFDLIDRTTSLPVAIPAGVALAVAGIVAVARPRSPSDRPDLSLLRVPMLGAAAGFGAATVIGYIANRYLADAVPLVVLAALPGFHVALDRARPAVADPGWRKRAAVGASAALVVAGFFGVYANAALGLWYQRAVSPVIRDDEVRRSLIDFQQRVDDALFEGPTRHLRRGDRLPAEADEGDLYVVGDCDGLYWSDGDAWFGVERTAAVGRHRVLVDGGEPATDQPVTLLRLGEDRRLVARSLDDGRGRVELVGPDGREWTGRTYEVPGDAYRLEVVADPHVDQLEVFRNHQVVFGLRRPLPPVDDTAVGRDLEVVPAEAELCQRLVERSSS